MLCYEVESSSKKIWRPSEDVENRKRFQVADSSRAYTSTECQDYISRITLSVSYFIYTGNKWQPEKTGDTGENAARNGLVTGGKRQLLLPFFVKGPQNSYKTPQRTTLHGLARGGGGERLNGMLKVENKLEPIDNYEKESWNNIGWRDSRNNM